MRALESTDDHPLAGRRNARALQRLLLLQFRPGDSFLHRLDPWTKLLVLLTVSVMALLFSSLPALIVVFVFELLLAFTSRIGLKFLRALTLISPFLIMVIILDSFFSKVSSGQVYFSAQIGFIHPEVTTGGIFFALAMGIRLLTLAGISFLFIMTTSPDDFIRSLKNLRAPPVLTFSLGYALHSTTTLAGDTRQIMDAQRSRGLELDRGTLIKNVNKFTALFIPLTISLIKRSKNTSDAMQVRGFRQSMPQSCYKSQKFTRPDLFMVIMLAGLVITMIVVNLYATG